MQNIHRQNVWAGFALIPGGGEHGCLGLALLLGLVDFSAKREKLKTFHGLVPESQGQNLALTVLYVS